MRVDAELHCHTSNSDGLASPWTCVSLAARKGLKVIAFTDHNTAEGGLPYWDEPLQNGVLVIPGEEITTDIGHILAYFVRETIFPGGFTDVVTQIIEQDALAFMAHPYHIPLGNRVRKKRILRFQPDLVRILTGMEVENGHNRAYANRIAWEFAHQHSIIGIAGSDAHFPCEIGNARTVLDLDELSFPSVKRALLNGTVMALPRRFNAYSLYLIIGLMNHIADRRFGWKAG